EAGDRLLKHLAKQLSEITRESDLIARFAGDEFVLILPETTVSRAKLLLQRVQNRLNARPLVSGADAIPVSISFGIASTEAGRGHSPETLLKIADHALYQMKSALKGARPRVPQGA
ncbi:MAG: GGDEF domain-containing protein, partial [Desulfobacterales bacterium]